MREKKNIAKNVGRVSYRGRTLPSLLYHASASLTNDRAFVQKVDSGWKPFTTQEFRTIAEETAIGLREEGLVPGDRVGMYMKNDVPFCVVDMGCLMAGLVDVPIYLTHTPDTIGYVLDHAEAHALVLSTLEQLEELAAPIGESKLLRLVVVDEELPAGDQKLVPDHVTLRSLSEIQKKGRATIQDDPGAVRTMSDTLNPSDLATIIYTSGTTGLPKGVMLTHENLSSNALASFSELMGVRPASDQTHEISLSFLPLTHVFARSHYYGAMAHGVGLYFTVPDDLVTDMASVRPTMLITVPRVLEKVYARIQERSAAASGLRGQLARWGLSRARRAGPSGMTDRLADRLVFRKWRALFGGRLRFLISGGAALSTEIAEVFDRAGMPALQGYGLTETSPVITFNRLGRNRPGTVGTALPEVQVRLAEDGEILTRGPHVMAGYFRDEERTAAALDSDGWFSTGDIGTLSDDDYLTITDRKKDLFKLSTGKYVMPQPLENRMSAHPLIEQAVVVGAGHKFAAALIFPNVDGVRSRLKMGSEVPDEPVLSDPGVHALFDRVVSQANEGMPHWTTIKRFEVVPDELTIENGLLTPTLKIKRPNVRQRFQSYIDTIYADEHEVPLDELNTEG